MPEHDAGFRQSPGAARLHAVTGRFGSLFIWKCISECKPEAGEGALSRVVRVLGARMFLTGNVIQAPEQVFRLHRQDAGSPECCPDQL